MRTATKLVTCLATVGGLLASTACGVGGTASPGGEGGEGGVALRMSVWTADEKQLALFDSIAAEYTASHPEVSSVTFESLPFADYNTTLSTQIAGGSAPDLAWVGDIAVDLMAADALVPLTEPFSTAEGYDYPDILPSVTQGFSKDGELYAYPFSNSPFAMYVNADLLAEVGEEVPEQLTWEEVERIGAEVSEETDAEGFVIRDFEYSSWMSLATVWTGWGATPWEGSTCTMNSPEMTEAFQFVHDAAFESGAMPGPGTSVDFFAGDAAFTTAQVSRAGLIDGSFEFEILPLPAGPVGEYATLGQAGMGVIASSENVEEATDFLTFMTNPENSAKLAQFFPPPRSSLLSGEKLAEVNTVLSAEQLDRVVVQELPEAVSPPVHTGQAEIVQTGKESLDAMWTPDADVKAVLDSTCTAIEPLLQAE
ncbi:ABC transporter substrate-binding protein [Auraticoccus monumenti]|uniref:Carbohydrate ABC transporter substrate-binding protein, CUT1 family n=1 Tax=Auraticoccus monumenti TaxID=675864 RepID=A0A1G6WF22_9ACTN|nr:sugar ABC transporter substrate-binding protein [Auraticoccus monumenti]SDD64408.1 carbohydrate ABC transporter substrate-binding protein, CUT1 family [Auraticoccus monumenti]